MTSEADEQAGQAEAVAARWLAESAETAQAHDLDGHFGLISRRVQVLGVPGIGPVGYDQWHGQCVKEFGDRLIRTVRYDGLKVEARRAGQITFRTREHIQTSDEVEHVNDLQNILEREADGHWRLVEQRVLAPGGLGSGPAAGSDKSRGGANGAAASDRQVRDEASLAADLRAKGLRILPGAED